MPEQPAPEPQKAKADAVSKPNAAPHGADPSSASAYIARPQKAPDRARAALALAALVAAGALTGAFVHFRAPAAPPPAAVAAAAREQKILTVTDADFSAAATERVRAGGSSTAAPSVPAAATPDAATAPQAPAAPAAVPPAPAAPAAPVETRAPSPLPIVPPELLAPAAPASVLTEQAVNAVRAEGWGIFSMRLLDNMDQDGDVVLISIDGVPMSYLSLTNAGAKLEIPLKKGESHRITVTAVRDGVGGVTLGLQTSAGMVLSRNMAVGQSESWTIDYK